MDRLALSASGLRHLRWGREIVASLEAHRSYNARLTQEQKETLDREAEALSELVRRLSLAVKPYRDFLEKTRVHYRAMQRLARFRCEAADREGTWVAIEKAEESRVVAEEAFVTIDVTQRRPLKSAVREAVARLHKGLDQMNERLGTRFDPALIDALYPKLTRSMSIVLDDEDEDDDATAAAEASGPEGGAAL